MRLDSTVIVINAQLYRREPGRGSGCLGAWLIAVIRIRWLDPMAGSDGGQKKPARPE
jgi:hypothetical protein